MSLSTPTSDSLPASLFGIAPNFEVLARLLIMQQSNARNGAIAHTKTRSERRGSTRKLYKQKGTGNARAGSARSPVRKGGWVAFGPRNNRNFTLDMNASERRLGLASALSLKASEGKIRVLESLEAKTSAMTKILKTCLKEGTVVVYAAPTELSDVRGMQNIHGLRIEAATHLNPASALKYTFLVFTTAALKEIEERFI